VRRKIVRVIGALLLAAAAFILWAGWPTDDGKVVFRLFVPNRGGDRDKGLSPFFRILIRFGVIVQNPARDYPASFYATYRLECSGTLIGRDTILTAAHCLEDSGEVEVVGQSGPVGRVPATCKAHPRFQSAPNYDVALCRINGSLPVAGGFERIATRPFDLTVPTAIRVSGWGYSNPSPFKMWVVRAKLRLGLGGNFRIGNATGVERGPLIVAAGQTTQEGQVALDGGDSGGAVYVGVDATRRIVGVNSCPNCYAAPIVIASLLDDDTVKFIADWKGHICGRDPSNDQGCRN